jgi:drug/metabolite transporter (DMT)-like permease
MANHISRTAQADGMLVLVTLIWGSTFLLVQRAVESYPVFAFLCLRFALASGVLLALFGKRLRSLEPRMWGAGIAIGFFLFGGYTLQTLGLQHTTSSKAGFITGLSVVIVPALSAILLKRVPEKLALLGVLLSTVGLALLTLGRDLRPTLGDALVLGCAVCFALHIVAVSRYAPRTDALALTLVQVAAVAVFSAVAATLLGEWQPPPQPVLGAAAFTGVLATALAFAVQNSVQAWTTATHTALIFATEPVFAGVFGYWLADERLTKAAIVGCILILLGMLVAELKAPVTQGSTIRGGELT